MNTSFVIQTPEFEGPLGLLLNLIEKRKLLINDVSLAQVTDSYFEHLQALEGESTDHMAEFILVAATLILIKSKSLLPSLDLTPEEELGVEDLEVRLQHYRVVKSRATYVHERFGQTIIFSAQNTPRKPIFSPGSWLTLKNLLHSGENILASLPKKEKRPRVSIKKVVRLEEVIMNLKKRIQKHFQMNFSDFADKGSERSTIIINFLALLELTKQGIIEVRQDEYFGEITLESQDLQTPEYGK